MQHAGSQFARRYLDGRLIIFFVWFGPRQPMNSAPWSRAYLWCGKTLRVPRTHAGEDVDTATYDLKARLFGIPLFEMLGSYRQSVPIYGSGGFTSYSDAELALNLAAGWKMMDAPLSR